MSTQQTGGMTEKQKAWTAGFTGLDPAKPKGGAVKPPAAPAAAKPATAANPAAAAAGAAKSAAAGAPATVAPAGAGKAFSVGVPGLPKKTFKAWGGRIEIEVTPVLKASGLAALDKADSTNIDMGAVARAAAHPALGWHAKQAEPALAGGGLFSNMKCERKGASLTVTSSSSTPLGNFTFELVIAGVGASVDKGANAKAAIKVMEAKITVVGVQASLPDAEVEGMKLSQLKLEAGAAATIAPAWTAIIVKWAVEEGLKQGAKTAATEAGEVAVAVIGADVVIVGSLITGGVATIGGAIYSIVMAWGIGDLAKGYTPAIGNAHAGFKTGMQGGTPPGDQYGKAGFEAGARNHAALLEKAKKDNPGKPEDAVKAAVSGKADEALQQVAGEIDKAVRRGLWDGYLAQHTTLLLSQDARWAFVACWGDFPRDGDPEWGKYVKAHPLQSKL